MKIVLICEGQDDLWFLCYYLHKKCGWIIADKKIWNNYKIPDKNKRKVIYMRSEESLSTIAVVSSNGQNGIKCVVDDILNINQQFPQDSIEKLVIFRDCDDRPQQEVASSMSVYFMENMHLKNRTVTDYSRSIDGLNITLQILPVVIPFDEQGAIETLLMKSISDKCVEGKYVVKNANEYIEKAIVNVKPKYLNKQREQTKAKYSATLAITNPTKSRDNFEELMMSTDWENSSSVDLHMREIRNFII